MGSLIVLGRCFGRPEKEIRNWAAHKLKFCGHLEANSGNPQAEVEMAIGHCCPGNVDFGIWQSKLSNQVKSTWQNSWIIAMYTWRWGKVGSVRYLSKGYSILSPLWEGPKQKRIISNGKFYISIHHPSTSMNSSKIWSWWSIASICLCKVRSQGGSIPEIRGPKTIQWSTRALHFGNRLHPGALFITKYKAIFILNLNLHKLLGNQSKMHPMLTRGILTPT